MPDLKYLYHALFIDRLFKQDVNIFLKQTLLSRVRYINCELGDTNTTQLIFTYDLFSVVFNMSSIKLIKMLATGDACRKCLSAHFMYVIRRQYHLF